MKTAEIIWNKEISLIISTNEHKLLALVISAMIRRIFPVRSAWVEEKFPVYKGTVGNSTHGCQQTEHLQTETRSSASVTRTLRELPARFLSCQGMELALCDLPYHPKVEGTLEIVAKLSPCLPTVKKRITVLHRTPPEVAWKWSLPLDLLCHVFFKALLTVFSYQPTFLSPVVSCLIFLLAQLAGGRAGAGSRLSPGVHSCDKMLHSELSESGQCPHKA